MSKKPAKAAADDSTNDGEAAPKKRSKLKLALFALVPLVLAGGGYAGWTFYLAPAGDAHAAAEKDGHEADGHAADGAEAADPVQVAAIPLDIAAETSFTHSYALGVIIAHACGAAQVPSLKAASEAEAKADGLLATLSWEAAARRTSILDDKNCRYLKAEVYNADGKAARLAAERAAPKKHEAKPAHH
ncbi:MAG: hypothetical protein H6893_14805 [Brucellaceae bacterium]|nr:hypothetical protein [Brucellaceae bacterium]